MRVSPPRQRETSSPDTIVVRNESVGLAIDCETATAHWHGERIDYDHALMVAMASWDSGDTRPEVGPVAGDWFRRKGVYGRRWGQRDFGERRNDALPHRK